MDAATMAALIVANLKTLNPQITGAQETELIAYWTLICEGIIDHIIAAAVVNTTGTVTGGGSSGGQPTASVGGIVA